MDVSMNLHLIGHARSSAYYRLEIPYLRLARHGHRVQLDYLPNVTPVMGDVLIIHKPFMPYLELYLEQPRRCPVIMDVDDLLWNPPPWSEAAWTFRTYPEWRRTLIQFLRQSDAVTVSTEHLKGEVLRMAPKQKVYVLPNMLDLDTFIYLDRRTRWEATKQITIGWYGSKSHVGPDLASIVGILPQAISSLPFVTLRIIGPSGLEQVPHLTRGLPDGSISLRPWVRPEDLPKELSALDIGLAPVADNAFNMCKSDLKPLEYAAAGVIPIYSDVPIYQDVPLGYRCKTSGDWIDALKYAIAHVKLGTWTETHLWPQSRSIDTHWPLWEQMLLEVTGASRPSRT
jgi:hypothetical protein